MCSVAYMLLNSVPISLVTHMCVTYIPLFFFLSPGRDQENSAWPRWFTQAIIGPGNGWSHFYCHTRTRTTCDFLLTTPNSILIQVSVNWDITWPDKGVSPIQCQPIILTTAASFVFIIVLLRYYAGIIEYLTILYCFCQNMHVFDIIVFDFTINIFL